MAFPHELPLTISVRFVRVSNLSNSHPLTQLPIMSTSNKRTSARSTRTSAANSTRSRTQRDQHGTGHGGAANGGRQREATRKALTERCEYLKCLCIQSTAYLSGSDQRRFQGQEESC